MLLLRIGASLLSMTLVFASLLTAGAQAPTAGTPATTPECAGAEEFAATYLGILAELETVNAIFESQEALFSASPEDLHAAAAEIAGARDEFAMLTPPPAGAEFHSTTLQSLEILSATLDAMATEGIAGLLTYADASQAINAATDAAVTAFEEACGVTITEDEATPLATPTSSSLTDPVPLTLAYEPEGEATLVDGWKLRVLVVNSASSRATHAASDAYTPPAAGRAYFFVHLMATRTGPEGAIFEGSQRLRLVGQSGTIYSATADGCGLIPDPIDDQEIFQTGTAVGDVCWSVRSEDISSLVLYDEPFPGSEEGRVYFSLTEAGAATPVASPS